MKLASTTFFISTSDIGRHGRTSRHLHRSNLTRVVNDRRPPNQLTAQWHICPQTGRLECAWSLKAAPSKGQCRLSRQSRPLLGRRHRRPPPTIKWPLKTSSSRPRTRN